MKNRLLNTSVFYTLMCLTFLLLNPQLSNAINVPSTGSNSVSCGTNSTVYDHAGTGSYSNNANGYTVLENSGTGVITLTGTYSTESGYDYLRIYSGVGTGGTLLASYSGSGTITTVVSAAGQSITVQFTSDGSVTGTGFVLTATYSGTCASGLNVPATGSNSNPCGTNITLYDNGGSGSNYANSSNGYTVLNAAATATINISGSYQTETNYDYIRIYSGSGTGGTLLATYHGTGTINYTGAAGQTLTVQFTSDGSVTYYGFALNVSYSGSCIAPYLDSWISMDYGTTEWVAGETRTVSVTVQNIGSATWSDAAPDINIGVKWNADADYFVRVNAGGLAPGASQTYYLSVTAPLTTGNNNLSFDLVNEGNFWFANQGNGCVVYTSPVLTIVPSCNTCPTYNYGIYTPTGIWQTHSSNIPLTSGCRFYAFNLVAGTEYYFKTGCGDGATASFDTYLELYDSSCTNVINNDDGCESNRSTITYTPSTSGTYYLKVRGYGGATGTYTLAYSRNALPGENCSNAQNLALLSSPYSATTTGYADDLPTCRTGYPDRIFYIDVPNGNTINIWQSSNTYDSYHYMGYGGTCPGSTQIVCMDDPDTQVNSWTNNTGSTQTVYFIVDGYSGSGDFILEWSLVSNEMIVPSTGNNSYTICSGNIYDAGGSTGDYNNSWDGYTVLYPDVVGNYISVSGTTSGETCCDYLYIYNGVGTSGTLLWSGVASSGAVPSISSTDGTGALSIRFMSDGSVTGAGFNLAISCNPPAINYTCSGTFTDSGGSSGNYNNNESQIWTFCPDVAGHSITMDFTYFELESTVDELDVYDGDDISDPNIGAYHGGLPLYGTVSATPINTSGCLTFRFTSDGSATYGGWEADISCAYPCQSVEVGTYNTVPAPTHISGVDYTDVCQGEQISFSATGLYSENGTYYTQSDATSTFTWYFGDGTTATGANVNHTYSSAGAYDVSLVITDNNNCFSSNAIPLRVRMSTTPDLSASIISPASLCAGTQLDLNGSYTTTTATAPPGGVIAQTTALPDGTGVSYYTANFITLFAPGQTVTSVNDIINVEANMEHSYLGDIDILLQCPNGQSVLLHQQTGSNAQILGEPIATDLPIDATNPAGYGNGYDYMWSPTSSNGYMTDAANWTAIATYTDPVGNISYNVEQVISQDYQAVGNWTNLIGCPLNGLWKLRITDYYANDNGYIFSWGVNFDPSLITPWGFTPSVSTEVWSGNNVSVSSNPGTAFPGADGTLTYTYSVTDNFGCSYDYQLTTDVTAPATSSLVGSDYVWSGNIDSDWENPLNWLVFDGSDYAVATGVPDATKNVFLRAYAPCAANPTNTTASSTVNCKDLNIETGLTLGNISQINVSGDFNNNGTFVAGTGTVALIGSSNQTLNPGGSDFNNITINNNSPGFNNITLTEPLTINGTASFNDGIINYSGTGALHFSSTASVSVSTNESFVDGAITRTGSTPFICPTGDINSRDLDGNGNLTYTVLGAINVNPSANTTVTAQYFFSNENGMPDWWEHSGNMDATLHHVSDREHWIVNADQNLNNITLYWYDNGHANGDICIHGFDYGNSSDFVISDLTTAYWTGSIWRDAGGAAIGNHDQGSITSALTIPFGFKAPTYITLGSKNNLNPLPVELTNFSGECKNGNTILNWKTASETNNSHFLVQMSDNMKDFETIGKIDGAGNSSSENSYNIEVSTKLDKAYFRLIQVDTDGSQNLYNPIFVQCNYDFNNPELQAYPNPFNNEIKLSLINYPDKTACVQVIDKLGKIVFETKIGINNAFSENILYFDKLKPSVYTVRIIGETVVLNQQIVKQ